MEPNANDKFIHQNLNEALAFSLMSCRFGLGVDEAIKTFRTNINEYLEQTIERALEVYPEGRQTCEMIRKKLAE